MKKSTLFSTNNILLLVFLFSLVFPPLSHGQINTEMRGIFKGLLSDLDPELRAKFQRALDRDDSSIEFTPQQFKRFRDNPINPFDGISDIDPNDLDGNIELKFELPSLRNRDVQPYERQGRSQRRKLRKSTTKAASSTVKLSSDGEQVALGVVVRADGMILTKASEVKSIDNLVCHVGYSTKFDAKVVSVDQKNDLAVVKIEAEELPVVQWADAQPGVGSFVLSPNQINQVISLGTYSAVARSVMNGRRAFLGVRPFVSPNAPGGVSIEVTAGDAAHEAGLQTGDVISRLDGVSMRDVTDLVNQIRKHSPGDSLEIEFVRSGISQETTAVLRGNRTSRSRAARYRMMERLGAIPSNRASNFPMVFQHDGPLFPEQCGGPITDLQGNVIGINIARHNRAASYAIPSAHVKTLLRKLLRPVVARRQDDAR